MNTLAFGLGFTSCSIVVLLYLLYQLVQLLKELVSIVREELKDD